MPIQIPEVNVAPGSRQGGTSGYEVHLDLGKIQGESNSTLHTNEIEVLSFGLSLTNSAVRSAQGDTTKGGKASVGEIALTKHTDKSTPHLFLAVTGCQMFPTATISLCKSTGGKKPEDYFIIKLTNAFISMMQLASPTGDGLGTETLSINFQKIFMDYRLQNTMGILVSAASATYDLTQGQ